jgi:hypothetical protein
VIDGTDASRLRGRPVRGSTGRVLGRVERVYVAPDTGKPVWVTIRLGAFRRAECFVPIGSSRLDEPELHVPYSKDTIRDAPPVEATPQVGEAGALALHRYYGLPGGG